MAWSRNMLYSFVTAWIREHFNSVSPDIEKLEKAWPLLGHIVHMDVQRGGRVTLIGDRDGRMCIAYVLTYVIDRARADDADPNLVYYYDYACRRIYIAATDSPLTLTRIPPLPPRR